MSRKTDTDDSRLPCYIPPNARFIDRHFALINGSLTFADSDDITSLFLLFDETCASATTKTFVTMVLTQALVLRPWMKFVIQCYQGIIEVVISNAKRNHILTIQPSDDKEENDDWQPFYIYLYRWHDLRYQKSNLDVLTPKKAVVDSYVQNGHNEFDVVAELVATELVSQVEKFR